MKNIDNWVQIKSSLTKYGYKKEAIKKIRQTKALPPTSRIYELERDYGIPWSFWTPYIEKYIERKNEKKEQPPKQA